MRFSLMGLLKELERKLAGKPKAPPERAWLTRLDSNQAAPPKIMMAATAESAAERRAAREVERAYAAMANGREEKPARRYLVHVAECQLGHPERWLQIPVVSEVMFRVEAVKES